MTKYLKGNALIAVDDSVEMPERDRFDFYPTPWGVIEYTMPYFSRAQRRKEMLPKRILDIGAGSGRWGQVARAWFPEAYIVGVEIQETPRAVAYDRWLVMDILDFLDDDGFGMSGFDFIVGNPPFYLFSRGIVSRFMRGLYRALSPHGVLTLVGRSAISESAGRYKEVFAWWTPMFEAQFVDRVSWYVEGHPRCGDTNATAHSLWVWDIHTHEFTRKTWAVSIDNDDTYTGPFKGTNTWQDMQRLGLVE